MRVSEQDRHYLEAEADAFFERNMGAVDPGILRPYKRVIAEEIAACAVTPRRVLEFGCNYGDLLHHYAEAGAECFGVEPSAKAVAFGTGSFGDAVHLVQGTVAENPISGDGAHAGWFDLIVVDDVFCWVSRETLYQSVANIDDLLCEGGHLFIREFQPLENTRNRNHHVTGREVWCFKLRNLHAGIFTASGMYEVVSRRVWVDREDPWAVERGEGFDARWSDAILRKSVRGYYR